MRLDLFALILSTAAFAQDLAPDVLLMARVKQHITTELADLPNIACLETVEREHQPRGGEWRPLDTVRLEVRTSGGKEFFAAPGAGKFDESASTHVASGVFGNGFFGLYLKAVLLSDYVSTTFKGYEDIEGRRLARYDYRLPLPWSGQVIRLPEGSGRVSLRGSYWADPQTFDVVRLDLAAEDIPPTLPIAEAVMNVNYSRTALNNSKAALLPVSAGFRLVRFSGEAERNRMEFRECRVFEARSEISFEAPAPADRNPPPPVPLAEELRSLPARLEVAVKLRIQISGDMPVGAAIEGIVAANVPTKGPVVIPSGSRVLGRIRRLEHHLAPFPYFVVAFTFTEVETPGIRYRFDADVIDIQTASGVEPTLFVPAKTEVQDLSEEGQHVRITGTTLSLPPQPGTAAFFFKGRRLRLPAGFTTKWKTRASAANNSDGVAK